MTTLIAILSAAGGLAGVTAFIKAFFFVKQDGEAKTIDNLKSIIAEIREDNLTIKKEFRQYREDIDERVAFFKQKFAKLEEERNHLYDATSEAHRCTYPPTIEDCPVIKYLRNAELCETCKKTRDHLETMWQGKKLN